SGRNLFGRTVGGKYVVRAVLGEGGMGTVYEAEHLQIGRMVAVKVLHPTQARKKVAVKRFHQEARAAGAIGHPNICEVYDLGELDLDSRVDLYACGVIMYEALTGRRPFVAANYNALLLQILTGSPRPVRDLRPTLPVGFDRVIDKAMARVREARYQTAAEFQR